jgi:periplasmic protein TonB
MTAYVHDTDFFTRRTAVFAFIVALHLFILWALATGLARRAIEVIAPPIQTDILQEEKTKVEPPPPPPPEMQKQVVEVPPPDINIAMPEVGPSTTAITATVATNKPAPPAPVHTGPTTPPKLTKPGDTEGYYPESSRRLGEEGTAAVHVCIAASGKLAGTPTVSQSSGKQRLDDAAINYAKAQRYSAGIADGKPVDGGCFDYRVKFALH